VIRNSLHYLGDCALCRGDGDEGATQYRQSVAAALDHEHVAGAAVEMEGLAMALAAQGRCELAIRLEAAAAARMEALGVYVSGVPFWDHLKQRYLAPARDVLGGPAAAALEAAGRAMGWEAAVAAASASATT